MQKILSLILLLSITFTSLFGYKQTIINGNASFAPNSTIRVYQYDDLLSYKRVLITSAKISKEGDFKFELNLTRPTYLMFCINFLESDFYAEPEESYSIHFEFNAKHENPAEISAIEIPMLTIIKDSTFETIFSKINALNDAIQQFLTSNDNFKQIYFRANQAKLDSLKKIIMGDWGVYNGQYFRTYQKYSYAMFDNIINNKNSDSIFARYFNEREFYVENTAFMDFFNSCFEKYYDSSQSKIPINEFRNTINEGGNLAKLLDIMGKDSKLKNEILREMVLIKMLNNAYFDDRFEPGNIILLLFELSKTTKFADHKKMALNVIDQLRNKVNGKKMIDFELKNVSGATTKLSEFNNKYLYIQFFTTDCNTCIRDMYGMQKLQEEYRDSVQFISISLDVNTAKLFHFVNKFPQFNWPILHFGNNFDFIEAYGLKGLPLAMILDKSGNIISNPAPLPDQNVTQIFNDLFKDKFHHKIWFEPGNSTIKPIK